MNSGEASRIVISLYTEWYSPLMSYALRAKLDSPIAAEDAVQEAFLALYSELVRGGSVHSPKGWIVCVLRRQIRKFRLQEFKQRDLCSMLRRSAPAHAAAYREVELEGLLSVLTRREAEVLQMRAKPMRYAEIAEALDISVNTVKTLLARAVRKMQEAARQNYPESFELWREPASPLVTAAPSSQ